MAGLFGDVSAAGGFDQSEIDLVTQLINSGQTTIDEVSSTFGVPRDVVASVYAQNAPQPQEENAFSGLLNTAIKANNAISSGAQALDALKTFNVLKSTPATATAAATTMEELAANNPMIIQNLSGSGSDGVQILTEAEKAAQMKSAADVFAGGLGSVVGAVSGQESTAETLGLGALSALGLINPAAALAYRLFDAMDLFGGGGLKATPMTPEEALKYAGESRLATTLQGAGEGAGELILDAIQQAEAAGVTPEKIAETLNTRGDLASELIGLTVGSNQMLSDADMAAAQASAETIADLTEDTTASELEEAAAGATGLESATPTVDTTVDANVAQNGSTGVSGGVTDVRETWNYDKATDSFISNTTGESIARTGDADVALKDGGEYSVRPVIGTEGVTAEHVVDEKTGKSVGEFTLDVLTGLPTLNKITVATDETDETDITDTTDVSVDGAASVGPAAPTGVANGGTAENGTVNISGGTLGGKYTGVARNGGGTLDLNVATNGADGADGTDGRDGADGRDGTDGRDGRDGRDGFTGLLALSSIATPLADEIFTNEFKMDYLKPELLGLLDLSSGRRKTGRIA